MGPKGGRREKHPRRRIVDAIFYVVSAPSSASTTSCAARSVKLTTATWSRARVWSTRSPSARPTRSPGPEDSTRARR
ncbi:hypothetical protein ACWD5F_30715 [Streptomyces sp. NPDC002499]